MIKKMYIAYGSNLNTLQMAYRCPDARPLGVSILKDHKLTFRGNRSGWGVANIEKCKGCSVPVGVWSISFSDEYNLDVYEGYPHLYEKEYKEVVLDGAKISCLVYVMTEGHDISEPPSSYLNTIREGYRDFGIDPKYLDDAVRQCRENIQITKSEGKMENWDELHNGDKVRCIEDGSVLECVEWRGEKYLAGKKDMWSVTEFDPKDWKIENTWL